MPANDPAFLQKLLAMFRVEADEHLALISSGLVELESAPPERRRQIVETIFREAHSLKGAARSVNLARVESICQSLETLFAEAKQNASPLPPEWFDRVHQMVSAVAGEVGGAPPSATPAATATRPPADDRPASDTVRVSTAKLAALLLQVEELNLARAAAGHRIAQLQELCTAMAAWERAHAATPLAGQLAALCKAFDSDRRVLERHASDLLDEVKRLSMLPFSMLLEVFPKLVRDLCRDCGKESDLVVTGAELEAERRILDELKDPLIHIVRNAIDHGIEPAAERIRAGKPARASITIAISSRAGGRVEVLVRDDGAGIDARKVAAAAVRHGSIAAEEAQKLSDSQALTLIFRSGLSTRPEVTEVSGRGLGLAIVHDKVARLGGEVTVESEQARGTAFRLLVPLMLARFRGVVVRAGGRLYVVPTTQVRRTLRVEHGGIGSVENRPAVELDGRPAAVAWLAAVLDSEWTPPVVPASHKWPGLWIEWADQRVLFLVDEVLQDQEVLVKSLGKQLVHVRNVSGAAILETGHVAPVLNVAELMQSAAGIAAVAPPREVVEKPKSILVAEDSITARTLVKGILESSGYSVTTAVDGAEAFRILETQPFDLVVSDVEMPRMTGFDLTAKIRASRRLSALPVVLVTALDSREDRERGADAGANAYIVKSSFDQSNLLEVVHRLIG